MFVHCYQKDGSLSHVIPADRIHMISDNTLNGSRNYKFCVRLKTDLVTADSPVLVRFWRFKSYETPRH